MATLVLRRLDGTYCCRQGNRLFFLPIDGYLVRWTGNKEDYISIGRDRVCLYGFRDIIFCFPFGNNWTWLRPRSLPAAVRGT